jgi:hypothetical protein
VVCKDFGLLASLYVAHFIVWRTLRAQRRERAVRLKNLKLVQGNGDLLRARKACGPARVHAKGGPRVFADHSSWVGAKCSAETDNA